ncbi:MAG: DUF3800 domain-containing protein [Nanoarchaeota archaeon]|nr:DUF3800 domain-containing protein [Nanoarchaeota archaeon]
MEILFIDESEFNKKMKKDCFILGGVSIAEENLINFEQKIDSLKSELKVKNLKEFRDTTKIKRKEKLKITETIVSILKECNVSVSSVIFGDLEENYWENYSNALYFILERFFLRLHRNKQFGLVICDSLSKEREFLIASKMILEIKNCNVILKGDDKGKMSAHVYPSILFQMDEFCNALQVADLICSSLQLAVREFKASNPGITIKGNEHVLKELSPYLELYYPLFEKGPFGIRGWGIKVWD